MAESDNLLTKLQGLLVYLIPQLNKFPRDQKFVLGDRIETKLLEVQESCLRAYYGREKRAHLIEANMTLEITRHLVRLAHALRLLSHHTCAVISEQVDESLFGNSPTPPRDGTRPTKNAHNRHRL